MDLSKKCPEKSGCFFCFLKFNHIVTKSAGQNIFYML